MVSFLYKWFFVPAICLFTLSGFTHPIFVSVIEIEHNAKEKSLEVSCKLFTDDFEKALRSTYKVHVDLLNPADRKAMDKLVNDYVQRHFSITADGKKVALQYLGYEQIEEGIYSYFEAKQVEKPASVGIQNNLLYEFEPQQMGLVHVIVNGERKSTKLLNPAASAELRF